LPAGFTWRHELLSRLPELPIPKYQLFREHIMLFSRTVMALATLSLFPLQAMAVMQCGTGLTHVEVVGRVTTLNVSDTKQAGHICMTMTKANGREVFDDCGALVGKIVSADAQTGSSTLTHTAVFDLHDMFRTRNDQAQITGVLALDETTGAPCAFSVVETISEFEKGAGIFRSATIDVKAEGSISFCPGNNLNTFTLKGEACVRK
jgi:hypothetical protein